MTEWRRRAPGVASAPLLFAIFASCSSQHGPTVSDTMTNWLSVCKNDADCRSDARCLNALCTLACTTKAEPVCSALSASAVCDVDKAACDLACSTSNECSQLGSGYACRDSRCRTGTAAVGEPGAPQLSDARLVSVVMSVEPEAERPIVSVQQGHSGTFSADEVFSLAEAGKGPSNPFVSGVDDHWRVVFSDAPGEEPNVFEVADVFADGNFASRRITLDASEPLGTPYKGEGRSIAHLRRGTDAHEDVCTLRVTDVVAGTSSPPWRFPCGAPANVAAVPGSDDWLVAWAEGDSADPQRRLLFARLDPQAQRFSAGPWQLARGDLPTTAAIFAANGDAWLWPTIGGAAYRVDAFARADARPDQAPTLVEHVFDTSWQDLHAASLSTGALFYAGRVPGSTVRIHAVVSNDVLRDFALDLPQREALQLAASPEREAVATCLTTSNAEVWLMVVDESGKALMEPQVLDRRTASGPEPLTLHVPGRCDLAWAGDKLLVVWERETGPEPAGGHHEVRARVISFPPPRFNP